MGRADTLVNAAIADHSCFKSVSRKLERLPPCEQAAQTVIDAFEMETCPAWLAAHLLGQVGATIGYPTILAILCSSAGACSEGYAGGALAKVAPDRALKDLSFVSQNARGNVMKGAISGLAAIDSSASVQAIFDATIGAPASFMSSISYSLLETTSLTVEQVHECLSSNSPKIIRLGLNLTEGMLFPTGPRIERPNYVEWKAGLSLSLPPALARTDVRIHLGTRESLVRFLKQHSD